MTEDHRHITVLPEAFETQMRSLLNTEWAAFQDALHEHPPTSILLNPNKPATAGFETGERVSWCPHGYYLPKRPAFTLDPLFHAGCYYVMEASSMLLWEILTQLDVQLQPSRVLDLCAAPGGKTAVLLSRLNQDSLLVSNEVSAQRVQALRYNIAKWGTANTISLQMDPSRIPDSGYFDIVLVDAPCSGEGLFRKDPRAVDQWSPDHVDHCAARQKRIIGEAIRLLRPNGTLIYSTCTYNSIENISQVAWMHKTFAMQSISFDLPESWGVLTVNEGPAVGYQCFPHRVHGEGFFIAAMHKNDVRSTNPGSSGIWKSARSTRDHQVLWQHLVDTSRISVHAPAEGLYRGLSSSVQEALAATHFAERGKVGTLLGRLKGKDIVPDHQLALSNHLLPAVSRVDLSLDQALRYLRRERIDHESLAPGWHLATFQSYPVGWLKQTQRDLKNQLPMPLRIRK